MTNWLSPLRTNYPIPEDFVATARKLRSDAIEIMLGFLWSGFDRLQDKDMFAVRASDPHLEDEVTQALFARTQDFMHEADPFTPFVIVHQWAEGEWQKDKGRAPQCDLAFRIFGGNVRSHFTIEAKVIATDGAVAPYVTEMTDNFLSGRYATFSSEAAMLGYLMSGSPLTAFDAISIRLEAPLHIYSPFGTRDHRYSDHERKSPDDASPLPHLRCHHILLSFGSVAGV